MTRLKANGTARISIASTCLREMEEEGSWTPEKEQILKETLAIMYLGSFSHYLDIILRIEVYDRRVGYREHCVASFYSPSSFLAQTVAVLGTFMMAMILYPSVQRKAQTLIDDKIGTRRLPEIADMGSIPYLGAIIFETLRWKPVGPIGNLWPLYL
jgi:hypothetical protein